MARVAWWQRLAGVKLAVDRVLVRVPRLRVAPERLLGAQVAHGRRGGELLGAVKCFGIVEGKSPRPSELAETSLGDDQSAGPQKREKCLEGLL